MVAAHVEVCVGNLRVERQEIERRIKSLVDSSMRLKNGPLQFQSDPVLRDNVSSVFVSIEGLDEKQEDIGVWLCELIYHIYQLSEEPPAEEMTEEENGGEAQVAALQLPLPAKELSGLWDSLIYDGKLKEDLLQYAQTAMLFSSHSVDSNIVAFNRVLLLHGPPGTGKTSLCRALAQKLAIRLIDRFPQSQLLEINAHSLFSRWFSESGKLVLKLFARIRELCEDSTCLVAILIDEVESLSAARQSALSGGEPSDAIRVVNALLTQLDRLRNCPNVIIFTTSNITQAIDMAFVDRADVKQFIGNPGMAARYQILRSCIIELYRTGLICDDPLPMSGLPSSFSAVAPAAAAAASASASPLDSVLLPWQLVQQRPAAEQASASPSDSLLRLCALCDGFSGRALRKLAFQAHAFFVQSSKAVAMSVFLSALEKAITREQDQRRILLAPPATAASAAASSSGSRSVSH